MDRTNFDEELDDMFDELPESCRSEDVEQLAPSLKASYVLGWYAGVRTLWRAARSQL